MFLRISILYLLLLLPQAIFSQKEYSVTTIPTELLDNANAVVRYSETDVTINSRKSMKIKKKRVVTVLNKSGSKFIKAREFFTKSSKVKDIEAYIYDASGKEIKRIKEKDFREASVSEGSVISDDRVLYLDYLPSQYPFTVVYTSETETPNTAFVPGWVPMEGTSVSVEKNIFTISCKNDLGFKYKTYNFDDTIEITKESDTKLGLKVEHMPALEREDYAPSFEKIVPVVLFGLDKFSLEGVEGEATSWEVFGTWMYNNLLTGTDELPNSTIKEIQQRTEGIEDPLQKAKIVYKYMQDKTRYISIQLGIGGWKPMEAEDVDRLGYGDCKALTNYTRSLLEAVGVESYYTVINAGSEQESLHEDMVSTQGNHVILAIPHNNDYVWLECTSQNAPFGFQGNFTDNRLALVVKPEGSELVRTHQYKVKDNTQHSVGQYVLNGSGGISGNVNFVSKGLQYDYKYRIEGYSDDELEERYKNMFDNIGSLTLKETKIKNDSDKTELIENITLEGKRYGTVSGNRVIFAVNAFNPYSGIPKRYRKRKTDFERTFGFYDTDEIEISMPEGYSIEAKPDDIVIKSKFGEYTAKFTVTETGKLKYERSLTVKEGYYKKEEYNDFRQFFKDVSQADNAKAVIIKK